MRRQSVAVQIVSMIDVMFFLVAFFLVFTTFKTETVGLNIELPRAVTGVKQVTSSVVLSITKEGAIYYEGRAVTPADLRTLLRPKLRGHPEVIVIIKADERAQYKSLVAAMDSVRAVGGFRIALAVEREVPSGSER